MVSLFEFFVGRVEWFVVMRSFLGWSELLTCDLVTLVVIVWFCRIGVGE